MAESIAAASAESGEKFFEFTGLPDGKKYPSQVIYCGVCSMPCEYCEYYPNFENCKKWWEKNLTEEMQDMLLGNNDEAEADGTKKKRQTRGGKGTVKTKKKNEPETVCLSRAPRGKRKFVTVVTGLASYDIDLKVASKYFANKFSCGASVTGDDEIVIQGDVKDDLFDMITEKWKQIDEDDIDDLGDMKR